MAKHKDPIFETLKAGHSFTWTMPEGGDLASMRAAIRHGQTLTMSPIRELSEIQVGDIVLVRWHEGHIYHLVGEIQGDQFLITNSVGKTNGWVDGSAILGRVTKIVDPEPRPRLSEMLSQLESAYRDLIHRENRSVQDRQRLLSIVDDLRWYAERIGSERSDVMPKANVWSFEQNLWRLVRQTAHGVAETKTYEWFVDRGKECVGAAAEIVKLLELKEAES